MAASRRQLPEEIPRIPTGRPGAIANRIFSKVSRKSKNSRKRLNSASTESSIYDGSSYDGYRSQPISTNERKDLKGRILEIFEENENDYIKREDSKEIQKMNGEFVSGLDSNTDMEDIFDNFSNLEKLNENEEDRKKLAQRSLELKTKMKDYINTAGKFKSMDVRTPVTDEKFSGHSVGQRRSPERRRYSESKSDVTKGKDDWAVNTYQAFHRSASLKNSNRSRASEAWSPSPVQSRERTYKLSKASKTYTKSLNKVLSSKLKSGNLNEEDSSERKRLNLMIWGCIICASCVILIACIIGVIFFFMRNKGNPCWSHRETKKAKLFVDDPPAFQLSVGPGDDGMICLLIYHLSSQF